MRLQGLQVERLYRREAEDQAPAPVESALFVAAHGIDGDCHADPYSPRQVLLVASGAYEQLNAPTNALRENLLVGASRLDWASGTRLSVGKDVILRITFSCEPCAKLNRYRPHLMREATGVRGVLARVVHGGTVRTGDTIRVENNAFPELSDDWQERVLRIVSSMTAADVLTYSDLTRLAGVHRSYARVLPRVLAAAFDANSTITSRILRSSEVDHQVPRSVLKRDQTMIARAAARLFGIEDVSAALV